MKWHAHSRHRRHGTGAHISRCSFYDCARVAQPPAAAIRTRSQRSAASHVVRRPHVDPMGWVLLFGLPFIALVSGCSELVRNWDRDIVVQLTSQKSLAMARAHLASLFIAATTLIAVDILAIVVLHVLAN
jgi:hypothetical protein